MNRNFLWFLLFLLCLCGIWLFVPVSVFNVLVEILSIRAVQVVLFIIALCGVITALMSKKDREDFLYIAFVCVVLCLNVIEKAFISIPAVILCAAAGWFLWPAHVVASTIVLALGALVLLLFLITQLKVKQ